MRTLFLHKVWLFVLVVCLQQSAQAQVDIELHDNWQFIRQDLGGIWEAVRPVSKADNPEAFPVWKNVQLPHCVNAEDAVSENYYQGPAWYRNQITINNPFEKGRTFLHFEGAGQKTDVYIYTTKVASHVGGYDEWKVDITDAVAAFKKTSVFEKQFHGKIPVSIRTDNSRDVEAIPSSLSDFSIYGGIYRNLHLVYEPAIAIENILFEPTIDKNNNGKITARINISNSINALTALCFINIKDVNGKVVFNIKREVQPGKENIFNDIVVRSPKLWSPEKPDLYSVETMIVNGTDTSSNITKIGFRTAEFKKHGPFFLNGKRLLLRGTHRHEDHAGVAAAMTKKMQRDELLLMKSMGVNFIRLGHYQQSSYILDLCDSLGILVWEEIPWCRGGLGGEKYKDQARQMLRNMIGQHYNHASVIMWGLGNENDWPGDFQQFDTSAIKTFMSELNNIAHSLDPARSTSIRRCDFCKTIPDVYSPTIWAGWYRGIYTDYKTFSQKEFDKTDRFFHAEWGGDSHARRHSEQPDKDLLSFLKTNDTTAFYQTLKGAKDGDWNESYICNLFDWHLREQETMPWLTGSAAWTFKDFSTPIRPDNPVPYVNQKGVVERDLTKKEAFYVFQSRWSDTAMAHIYGHSAPVRWGNENEEKLVKVYSNCDRAELFLNGKSLGIKKRDPLAFPATGFYWATNFISGNNELKVVATKGKTTVVDSVQFFYQTKKWGKPAKAMLEKLSQTDSIVTLQVKLLDADGLQCLDATNWVRFNSIGAGTLIAGLGTSTGSDRVQMYNGIAIIKIKKGKDKCVVNAVVEGVSTVWIDL